ncbi:MAG TPA: AraC family transcriptional regulator [Candidatus Kapabacteria bacterium]|nr:AraC family transcriptional regulator [Candidatus Kapabacteria bacterium]
MINQDNKYKFEINYSALLNSDTLSLMSMFLLSDKIKKGFKLELNLDDGLKLVVNEYKPKRNLTIDFKVSEAPFEFAYCLSGRMNVEFHSDNGQIDFLEISQGTAALFHLPNTYGILKVFSNELLKVISLHCSYDYLNKFLDDSDSFIKSYLNNNSMQSPVFIEMTKGNSNIKSVANNIIDCDFVGKTKDMFLKAKSNELMIYIIEQIKLNYLSENEEFTKYNIESANKIESLLNSNLIDPPSLLELADMASMTHTKLNRLFKKLYGNTVFGYLRELRLNQAKKLLDEGQLNITQIAYETGWSNPSHFSREFKEWYGLSPKTYTKQIRK